MLSPLSETASNSISSRGSLASIIPEPFDNLLRPVSVNGSQSQKTKLADLMDAEDDYVMDAAELLQCLQEIDDDLPPSPSWEPIQDEPQLIRPSHCRREAVVCVVSLKTISTFCYAVVSRLGRVGVYDAKFVLLDSYSLELGFVHPHAKIGIGREGDTREPRQHSTWVNDAVFLPDAQALVVAASDRSLTILDASRLLHSRRSEIRSLPSAPRCLAYAPTLGSETGTSSSSRLFIGDDDGVIATLAFKRPKQALLRPPDAEDKRVSFFWKELQQQPEWVSILDETKVHGDMVCRLAYSAHNDTLVSCSRDHRTTLVIRHLTARRVPYTFSIPRGASCFVLERSLQLLVTGGRDTVVRLWNPLVPSQPQAFLRGHKAPILDVAVLPSWEVVLSMDKRGALKVWHVAEQVCLQTLELPFSSLGVPGRKIEHGNRSLYAGPPVRDKANNGAEVTSGSPGGVGVLLAALCGELVLLRVLEPPGTSAEPHTPQGELSPPRREQSPAIPDSWSPSLLEPSSDHSSSSSARDEKSSLDSLSLDERPMRSGSLSDSGDLPLADPTPEYDPENLPFPKSQSPLPDAIEDWPVPDDSVFKEEEPTAKSPPLASTRTQAPQPVSHRPVPDEDGLYPEEIASLRALGLRPLDLESIGVNLGEAASGDGGTLSLLPMDTLAVVRQAHALQKKSRKQMRTLAWHCVPHLALKLPEETPLRFSRALPVSSRMRAKGLDVSDPERLMQAKLGRLRTTAGSSRPSHRAGPGLHPPQPAQRAHTRGLSASNASSFKMSSASGAGSTNT